ncbi:MAG: hypothetical protein PHU66_07545, partial [Bacteroidaceae bacterium]|nr:hypothetical protein [Bacteroidaceae bacterium]
MKKVFFLVALFIMSSAVWNSSAGTAKRSVQALTGSGGSYTYDQDAPLITDASQFSSNSSSASDGSSYANLIDGNTETIFHSVWETAMADANTTADTWATLMTTSHATEAVGIGYHNLQVALNNPVSSFIFKYSGRNSDWHDNPNDILIYATNDDALAQNVDASTSASWTEIEEFTDPTITDVVITNYISPVVELGGSYKYIRFVIKGTTHMNKVDTRTFVKPDITGVTWNVSEFQMYEAVEVTSPLDKLKAFADSINTLGLNFTASLGSDPGFYSQANYDAYTAAKDKAEQYLAESHTDAEYAAVEAEYRAAYKGMVPNPVREGYYNIVSAESNFSTAQPNTTKAMYTEGDSLLYWGDLNTTQGRYLFHITAATDGSFDIQNVASKLYIKNLIGDVDQDNTQVYLSVNPDVPQQFKFLGSGQFNIFNENLKTDYAYNTQGNNSGAGVSGTVCRWTSSANNECAWYLKEVTDQDLINTLINGGSQEILTSALNNAITKGETARNKANDYTALITNASQISSNAQSPGDGSSYANLIDGNTSTIFHSVWDGTFKTVVTEGIGWHNLQFALPYAISKMKFNYTGRNDASWADSPDHITIYGTNDDALGASTAAADSSSWSEITDLTDGFPGNVALSQYSSPMIDLNGSYKYLRFVVKHTTNENKQGDRTFVVPEITGVTFNLSEMQVYDGNPATGSEYNTVTGMKAACDALDAMITQARTKVTANTATQADVDALTAAIKAVNDLYVDRDAYYSEFTALLDSSNTVYNNAMGAKQKLITSADQFSTNSSSADDGSSFANLIDGNTETIFHSHWDTAMADPTATADSWATLQTTWITNNTSNIAVGTGYHNLQVKLTEPVNNFYFQYTGRNSDWHDNPNDIQILATNDDALGNSVLASDSTQWTNITELNENLNDVGLLAYTSPQIELVNSYKYIRFVIKNTTHKDKVDTRKCVNPFITGVTWNVSEFQMYTGLNPERVQYNYIPEVKEAVDALKKILDVDGSLTKSDLISYDIIATLRAAKDGVLSQYADSTELASLYKRYINYADSSVVGDGIGYVKTQDAITTFRNAVIAAKAPVSPTQPTKSMLTTATDALKSAFATFMTSVGQIVPNQWYNILSGSDYAYAQNQPIFLGSTSTGAQLRLGNYPIDQIPPAGDPYCIWRFIPIDG